MVLANFRNRFGEYTELRAQENIEQRVRLLNGEISVNSVKKSKGVAARVYKNGVWGFSATSDSTDEGILRIIEKAESNATLLNSCVMQGYPPLPSRQPEEYCTLLIHQEVDQKDLIEIACIVDAYLVKNCPRLTSRQIRVNFESVEKHIQVSDGAAGHTAGVRTHVLLIL